MTEGAEMENDKLGDAEADDLALHREFRAKERLDTILEAPGLTPRQAVNAMSAMYTENQATFPHMIEAPVMVSSAPGLPQNQVFRSYVGPFRDRRAAEAWAEGHYAGNHRVLWQAIKIVPPENAERNAEAVRHIIEDD